MRAFLLAIAFYAAALGQMACSETFERAYWVWGRADPLSAEEASVLTSQGVRTLYWKLGELDFRVGGWQWKSRIDLDDFARPAAAAVDGETAAKRPASLRIVPVIRLAAEARGPFGSGAVTDLVNKLQPMARDGALQIDFDCPDRQMLDYAGALGQLRRAVPHLSITALTHWPKLRHFQTLTRSVEEMVPMFYDMQADPTGVSAESPPPALLDPKTLVPVLQAWSGCPIPWRAGLPSFARLTVFDHTGLSRGQIPNWNWDDACFHKELRTLAPTRQGVTMFRADADTLVARTAVTKGDIITSRSVDRTALSAAKHEAQAAGASGVVFFRLSDGSDPSGWSAEDLGALDGTGRPGLILRPAGVEKLELFNASQFDLPARLSGEKSDRDRGYALELDAPGPVFRDALAGDFWRVTGHVQPDSKKPMPAPVQLATRLTFWFSHLPAHARLQTGLIQLAPGVTVQNIRYRILNCESATLWRPIPPSATAADR